jgi:translation initiation factor 2B subunit (eIF-2B alpha/beta/delta family)
MISESISDFAEEQINDNEVILTANSSEQLADFFISASQGKKFKLFITESAPTFK